MKVTLFGIPGSHPVRSARLMLEYKGIPYRNVDLLPVLSRVIVPHVLRFPNNRVPAMKVDGRKVQGTLDIALELDRLKPEPPLFPAEPEQRKLVERAERWGDDFQGAARTTVWWAMKRSPVKEQETFLSEARLGAPPSILARTGAPLVWAAAKLNDADDFTVARLLEELPVRLDQIDEWIAQGVLDGEQLNAADFQIGTTLRLLMAMEDLRPAIENRPAGKLALRVQPKAPGKLSPVFPEAWLRPLRETATV